MKSVRPLVTFSIVFGTALLLSIALVLFVENRILLWMGMAAIWGTWMVLFVMSFYRLKPDERLAAFYLATFDGLYVSGSDYESLKTRYGAHPHFTEFCRRGLPIPGLGDIAYLQWPFYYDVRPVTTGVIRIHVEAAQGTETKRVEKVVVWREEQKEEFDVQPNGQRQRTKVVPQDPVLAWAGPPEQLIPPPPPRIEERRTPTGRVVRKTLSYRIERESRPRVEMSVNVDVIIQLGLNLGPLIRAVPGANLNAPSLLGTHLSERGAQPVIQEALTHAMKEFTWEGEEHIRSHLGDFEKHVIRHLRKPGTFFVEAGLLAPLDPNVPAAIDPMQNRNGAAVETIDIAIEEPRPRADALREAMNEVAIGTYQGEATRQRELGLTLALKDRVEAARAMGQDLPYEEALLARTLENSNLAVIGGGGTVLDGLGALLGGRRRRGGGQRGGGGQQQGRPGQGPQGP